MTDSPQAIIERLRRLRAPGATCDRKLLSDLTTVADVHVRAAAGRTLEHVPLDLVERDGRALRPLKIALAATFMADNTAPLLRTELLTSGVAPTIHTVAFGQTLQELTQPGSELEAFGPQVTLILLDDGWFLPAGWDPNDFAALSRALHERFSVLREAVRAFAERSGSVVVLNTVPLSEVERRSVISFRGRARLGRVWRTLNSRLLRLAEGIDLVHALDLEATLVESATNVRDDRLFHYASAAWTITTESVYTAEAAALCRAVAGAAKKVLAIDLDGVLWGGTLGDDGPVGIQLGNVYPGNAFRDVQARVKALERQGVVVAAVSKNEQRVVDELWQANPEMLLDASAFAAFAVSWQPKDRSLRDIADELNLDLGTIVFVDDSAFECELVRTTLPAVDVIHLQGDPATFPRRLLAQRAFDVLETGAADRARTRRYHERKMRIHHALEFTTAEDYLHSLGTRIRIREADESALARLAQLARRTNQFNMVGNAVPVASDLVLSVEVADRFGDEGLVAGVWIDCAGSSWLIENFVMSCRVFARGIEFAVLQHVAERAAAAGATNLLAAFRDTGHNAAGAACYPAAGFVPVDDEAGDAAHVLRLDPLPQLHPDWITMETEKAEPDAGTR